MILSERQIREGRVLVSSSQVEIAAAAEVAVGLIVRIEAVDGMAMARKPDLAAIRGALEASGVISTPASCEDAGGRLRRDLKAAP